MTEIFIESLSPSCDWNTDKHKKALAEAERECKGDDFRVCLVGRRPDPTLNSVDENEILASLPLKRKQVSPTKVLFAFVNENTFKPEKDITVLGMVIINKNNRIFLSAGFDVIVISDNTTFSIDGDVWESDRGFLWEF